MALRKKRGWFVILLGLGLVVGLGLLGWVLFRPGQRPNVKVHGYDNLNEALQRLDAFASERPRLWLVRCQAWFKERQRLLRLATTWLERHSSMWLEERFAGVQIKFFQLRSAVSASKVSQ